MCRHFNPQQMILPFRIRLTSQFFTAMCASVAVHDDHKCMNVVHDSVISYGHAVMVI